MQDHPNDGSPLVNVKVSDEIRRRFGRTLQRVQEIGQRYRHVRVVLESDDWQSFWTPATAAMRANQQEPPDKATIAKAVTDMYSWAKDRGSYAPDGVIGAHLEQAERKRLTLTLKKHLEPKRLGEVTPRETWALVDGKATGPNGQFIRHARGLAIVRVSEGARAAAKTFPEIDEALAYFAVEGQAHSQAQKEMFPAIVYELLEGQQPTAPLELAWLGGKANNQIREDYQGRRRTHLDDVREAASFSEPEDIERALQHMREFKLPPREFELCRILLENPGISNREAGEKMGVKVRTVINMRASIRKTLGIYKIA